MATLRLSVFGTAADAFAFVWRERRDFEVLAIPAILTLTVLGGFFLHLQSNAYPNGVQRDGFGPADGVTVVYWVLSLVTWVMFCVAWHRRLLVPDEATKLGMAFRWRWRQTRFLPLFIAAMLLFAVADFLYSSATSNVFEGDQDGSPLVQIAWHWAMLVIYLPALLIYARLSMLFPATAVDHHMSFIECWRLTHGNGLRLAGVVILIEIPIGILAGLLQYAFNRILTRFDHLESPTAFFLGMLITETMTFIGLAAGVSALSLCYRALLATPPDTLTAGTH